MLDQLERCLTVRELAQRWRCRPSTVRALVRRGALPAIQLSGRLRITPEAVHQAEAGFLAVRPRSRRRRERIDREVADLLAERGQDGGRGQRDPEIAKLLA